MRKKKFFFSSSAEPYQLVLISIRQKFGVYFAIDVSIYLLRVGATEDVSTIRALLSVYVALHKHRQHLHDKPILYSRRTIEALKSFENIVQRSEKNSDTLSEVTEPVVLQS